MNGDSIILMLSELLWSEVRAVKFGRCCWRILELVDWNFCNALLGTKEMLAGTLMHDGSLRHELLEYIFREGKEA